MSTETYFADPESEARAYELARNSTQRAFLDGTYNWSLSCLKGNARNHGGWYASQRDQLLEALRVAGLAPVTLYPSALHGRRIVVI